MAIGLETIQQLGLSSADQVQPQKQELGQDQFLELMVTQLTHQDPTNPMENGDFLAQMAQFSTVEGITGLQESFETFAASMTSNQAIQAAGLVGRSVAFPSDSAVLALDKPISGNIKLEQSTNQLSINILDQNGVLVKNLNLGNQAEGLIKFEWDGLLDDGSYAEPGVYKIEAQANIDGENTALETFVSATVESVDLGNPQKGVVLNLGQLGSIEFSKVNQVF